MDNPNMELYNKVREVPAEAKKTITAGRLKGMTDINPMWRIAKLTEVFGPCGFGWWYEITEKRIELGPYKNTTKTNEENSEVVSGQQAAAFVDIVLYVKNPQSGEVSHGIPGTGGASFVAQESKWLYMSDECFKMALTDAISVATKALGFAADVYWAAGRSKYTASLPLGDPDTKYICADCGRPVTGFFSAGKQVMTSDQMAEYTEENYGRHLCAACAKKAKDNAVAD